MNILDELKTWVENNCPNDIDGLTMHWQVLNRGAIFHLSAGRDAKEGSRLSRIIQMFKAEFAKEEARLSGKQERAEQFKAALDRFVAEVAIIEGKDGD